MLISLRTNESCNMSYYRDRLQISLLILSEFKRVNQILLPVKSSENRRFSDHFMGNRIWLIRLNSLNIRTEN